MKTVRDACVLQDNALDIHVSDQIDQLDQLIADEGEGRIFFDKTHITLGMKTMLTEGLARLAAKSNQAVFHLKQAMGGGKTHLLVGFGLLAKHPGLRTAYCADIPYANAFYTARIAAFNGRNNPQHFLWGEIAHQLGKVELFRDFWASGPKATAEKMLQREILEEEEDSDRLKEVLDSLTPKEATFLQRIVNELSRPEARDPKLAAVRYFLTDYRTKGKR